jgi:hypothetical protein
MGAHSCGFLEFLFSQAGLAEISIGVGLMKRLVLLTGLFLIAMSLVVIREASVEAQGKSPVPPANVTATRMERADQESGNWMSYGRTYTEQHFSTKTHQ